MKTKLRKILLFTCIILFAVSCKKDSKNNDSDYYVKVNKNGNLTSYPTTVGELGPDLLNSSYTNLGVTGQTTDGNERFDIDIQVSGATLSTGTYDSNSFDYTVFVSMLIQNGSQIKNYDIDSSPGMPPSRFIINITSITNDAIEGTFTGNYVYDSFSGDTIQLTEGQFRVKRAR